MAVGSAGPSTAFLRSRLLAEDPYAGFPIHDWPLDLQGWGSRHPLFGELIEVLRPGVIVEVGTWKGASAIHMAREAKRRGLPTKIICIDTWLGSAGAVLRRDESFDDLRHRHGYPQLYFQFLANVLHTGTSDVIVPLPQTSDNAARILRELDVHPDLVYLDAAHDCTSVRRDLDAYFSLLGEPSALIGDDFVDADHPDLVRAVREFAADRGLALRSDDEKFILARDPTLLDRVAKARNLRRRSLRAARRIRRRMALRR